MIATGEEDCSYFPDQPITLTFTLKREGRAEPCYPPRKFSHLIICVAYVFDMMYCNTDDGGKILVYGNA